MAFRIAPSVLPSAAVVLSGYAIQRSGVQGDKDAPLFNLSALSD